MEKPTIAKASDQSISGKKYVMVIDLAKCKNARKCVEKCQKAHYLPPHQELMKVYLMQESEEAIPYWMPKPCFHCDEPLCVSSCPAGATMKQPNGIVLIDKEKCIGCKKCSKVCPFSSRQFNHGSGPAMQIDQLPAKESDGNLAVGNMQKCDFCHDLLLEGKMPECVAACPSGVIYFGDQLANLVSNSCETVSFSDLIASRSGYRYLEELGTQPRVYYLPPLIDQHPINQLNKKKEDG